MTNCKTFTDKLALLALGELGEDETRQVNLHLADCAGCADDFKRLMDVTSILDCAIEDDITELEKLQIENTVYRHLANSQNSKSLKSWVRITLRLAAALILIGLGFVGGNFSFETNPKPDQPISNESRFASLDRKVNMASFRLSPEGLKMIARGRESLKHNLSGR